MCLSKKKKERVCILCLQTSWCCKQARRHAFDAKGEPEFWNHVSGTKCIVIDGPRALHSRSCKREKQSISFVVKYCDATKRPCIDRSCGKKNREVKQSGEGCRKKEKERERLSALKTNCIKVTIIKRKGSCCASGNASTPLFEDGLQHWSPIKKNVS